MSRVPKQCAIPGCPKLTVEGICRVCQGSISLLREEHHLGEHKLTLAALGILLYPGETYGATQIAEAIRVPPRQVVVAARRSVKHAGVIPGVVASEVARDLFWVKHGVTTGVAARDLGLHPNTLLQYCRHKLIASR